MPDPLSQSMKYPPQPDPSQSDIRKWRLAESRGHLERFDSLTLQSIYGWSKETYGKLKSIHSDAATPVDNPA